MNFKRALRDWLWMPLLFLSMIALCAALGFFVLAPQFTDPQTLFGPPPPNIPLRLLLSQDEPPPPCTEVASGTSAFCSTTTPTTDELPYP